MDKQELKKITQEELDKILELHRKYLTGEEGGVKANLSYTDLAELNLNKRDLIDINISHSNLRNTKFFCSNLIRVDFYDSNLEGADFGNAKLNGIRFDCANLTLTDFNDAYIRCCGFIYSNLNKTNFNNATLYCIDIMESGLNKAKFYLTNLHMVNKADYVCIGNIGSRNDTTYYFYNIDRVICGCFDGTMEEFEEKVDREYGKCKDIKKLSCWKEYNIVIDTLKKLANIKIYKNKNSKEKEGYKYRWCPNGLFKEVNLNEMEKNS